ncbi:hypothetical protein K474DRAFT_1670505 [Panus rudis PR-1116 ss-1]|nr:hypothetical protein K474DRAFT_1670505 [Panus rudis PR-1116 ss-1]
MSGVYKTLIFEPLSCFGLPVFRTSAFPQQSCLIPNFVGSWCLTRTLNIAGAEASSFTSLISVPAQHPSFCSRIQRVQMITFGSCHDTREGRRPASVVPCPGTQPVATLSLPTDLHSCWQSSMSKCGCFRCNATQLLFKWMITVIESTAYALKPGRIHFHFHFTSMKVRGQGAYLAPFQCQ